MKRRVWSSILCLELLLAEAWFLWSVVLGYQAPWTIKKQIMVGAAVANLLFFAVLVRLFKSIKNPLDPHKFEVFSRYVVQAPVWLSLSLLLVELALRVTIYNPPLRRDATNWAGDIPGVHTFILWGKEGYAVTQYDKWGALKTPFHDNKKDNNIIVLGDSQTECWQVPDNLKFVSVAETLLRRDGYDADLHNLGRSGLAMADYVSWIPPYRKLYRPRAIAVQATENDFIESFEAGQFNYFVVRDGGLELVHVYDFSAGFIQQARKKYRFSLQVEELGAQRLRLMGVSSTSLPFLGAAAKPIRGFKPPLPQSADNQVFDPLLADLQMNLLLEVSEGVPLIVVLLPSAPYISGDGIEMNDPVHERLKDFMAAYSEITLVDPLPEFQRLALDGRLPRGFFNTSPGSGHLNEDGNRIVGKLLADAIAEALK